MLGRFDRHAPQREFGLQLGMEQLDNGCLGRVAWVIDLYLPRKCRRNGAGTRLIESLMKLWEEAGVAAARATTTEVGFAAFTSWGFTRVQGELEDQLQPVHLLLPRDRASGESSSDNSSYAADSASASSKPSSLVATSITSLSASSR